MIGYIIKLSILVEIAPFFILKNIFCRLTRKIQEISTKTQITSSIISLLCTGQVPIINHSCLPDKANKWCKWLFGRDSLPGKNFEIPFFLKTPYQKGVFYFMQQSLLNVTKFLLYYVQYFLKKHFMKFYELQ